MEELASVPECRSCGNSRGNASLRVCEMLFGTREEFSHFRCAGLSGRLLVP